MKNKTKLISALFFTAAAVIFTAFIILKANLFDTPPISLAALVFSSLLIWAGGAAIYITNPENGKIMRCVIAVIFVMYLLLLINYTVFDGSFGRVPSRAMAEAPFSEYFRQRGNLIPFRMIYRQTRSLLRGTYRARYYLVNILGNIAAFAPCALFLQILFKRCRKFPVFFAITSAMILSIESVQLVTRLGSFDVDDYILNILGASALFALTKTKAGAAAMSFIAAPSIKKRDKEQG